MYLKELETNREVTVHKKSFQKDNLNFSAWSLGPLVSFLTEPRNLECSTKLFFRLSGFILQENRKVKRSKKIMSKRRFKVLAKIGSSFA